jgi:hypothetical protein
MFLIEIKSGVRSKRQKQFTYRAVLKAGVDSKGMIG